MTKSTRPGVGRRNFLRGAAVAGAATLAKPIAGQAQAPVAPRPVTPPPSPDGETGAVPHVEMLTQDNCGSDFMVDCIKSLGVEYIASNPGSSFRSMQDSVITYGGNKAPEF